MITVKKAALNEVKWQLPWNVGDQANYKMTEAAGADCRHFATLRVSGNTYLWAADSPGWQCLADLAPAEPFRTVIRAAYEDLFARVASAFGTPEQAAKALGVPNESFIFFKLDAGNGLADLLITGWGFTNWVNPKAGFTIIAPPPARKSTVSIGFTIEGTPVPHRPFAVVTAVKENTYTTDADGLFCIGTDVPAGTGVHLRDIPSDHHFSFITEVGREQYLFDVTASATVAVTVTVERGGTPVAGATVSLSYAGRDCTLVTGPDGSSSVALVLHDGADCIAKLGSTTLVRPLSGTVSDNVFAFSLPVPAPDSKVTKPALESDPALVDEAPVAVQPRVLIRGVADFVGVDYPVTVNTPADAFDARGDMDGNVGLPACHVGDTFTVIDGFDASHVETYVVEADRTDYLFRVPYAPAGANADIGIRVEDVARRPVAGVPIVFRGTDGAVLTRLDGNGRCFLDKNDFAPDAGLTATIKSPTRSFPAIGFHLVPGETDYLLREVRGRQPWWHVAGEVALIVFTLVGLGFLAKPFVSGMAGLQQLIHL